MPSALQHAACAAICVAGVLVPTSAAGNNPRHAPLAPMRCLQPPCPLSWARPWALAGAMAACPACRRSLLLSLHSSSFCRRISRQRSSRRSSRRNTRRHSSRRHSRRPSSKRPSRRRPPNLLRGALPARHCPTDRAVPACRAPHRRQVWQQKLRERLRLWLNACRPRPCLLTSSSALCMHSRARTRRSTPGCCSSTA